MIQVAVADFDALRVDRSGWMAKRELTWTIFEDTREGDWQFAGRVDTEDGVRDCLAALIPSKEGLGAQPDKKHVFQDL